MLPSIRSTKAAALVAAAFACLLPLVHGAPVTTLTVASRTYANQGLVGMGRIPAVTRDLLNETFGSYSAFTFAPGSWRRLPDGSYAGTLYTQPDRGYNVDATTNYIPRFNILDVTFTPADAGSAAQDQVKLTLQSTVTFKEADGTPFTSYDPTPVGVGSRTGFPNLPQAFNGRLSLDAEGIVVNPDGTLWVSDEYGPYIFRFAANGTLLGVIRPPEALIPKRGGSDSFASNNPGQGQPVASPANPVTGRQNNQGLEGLSMAPDGRTLFTLLQSATRQDGGTGGTGPRRYTRLLRYDVSDPTAPVLTGHWVLALPTFTIAAGTRVPAQSEILAVNSTQFLVLARDGAGRGTATPTSDYRAILLYDLGGATNLLGTTYETADTAVAPGGVLAAGITPLTGQVLIDMNNTQQLAKFGLTNGPTDSPNNMSEKWEALALVPALDPAAPDDWFLFVGNDNDFLTTAGFHAGASYAAAVDNDNVVLVYRLTLPTRLTNISARARVGAGEAVHITGFVSDGAAPKQFLLRALGPGIAAAGVTTALANPKIEVFDNASRLVATNNDWGTGDATALASAAVKVGAQPLAAGSRDAALLVTLPPGAYTMVTSSADGSSGVALAEAYEVP